MRQTDQNTVASKTLSEQDSAIARRLVLDLKWPIRELPLGPDDVMLTDAVFVPLLQDAGCPCAVQDIEDADVAGLKAANLVYVLTRRNERRIVRRYNTQFARKKFVSATYEGFTGWPEALATRRVTLLAATRHSGAAYLADMLPENGFCRPIHMLSEGQRLWACLQEDFDPIRSARATLHRTQFSVDHAGDFVLEFDPLDYIAMTARGQGDVAVMNRLLKGSDTQAMYFVRRNKAEQATIMQSLRVAFGQDSMGANGMLAEMPELSSLKKRDRKILPEPDAGSVRQSMFSLLTAEAAVEALLGNASKMRMLTLEELYESPVEVMKALGPFLGQQRMQKIRVLDGRAERLSVPWMEQFLVAIRQDLVAFLNLDRTEAGSFTTPTLRILDTDGR